MVGLMIFGGLQEPGRPLTTKSHRLFPCPADADAVLLDAWSDGFSGRTTRVLASGGSAPISQRVLMGEFALAGAR